MLRRTAAALVLVLLCAVSILRVTRPPSAVPATAPDSVFSAERAMRHVAEIAVRPHAVGMADHDRVRDYIVAELTALGLHPQIQRTTAVGTRYRVSGRVQNIVAWMPGSDTKGKAVLLMAHYDGIEAGPAASDDGAGAAALLETARALRARKTPLVHDIIMLFTDGEEAGLLGSAAFVREHPWAKDVAVVVNLEARGTTGRSFMFETGPGNLDVARALRRAGHATAGSVFAAVYRVLPNDTDLSELALLRLPALNFAFAGGVERYHTGYDNVAHLNPGSLQQHGDQMLALAQIFASEPLPRPKTSDGVYFGLPLVGLVVYPEGLAIPLAIVAVVLVGITAVRERRGVIPGVAATLVAVIVSALLARPIASWLQILQSHMPWGGASRWSGMYVGAVGLFATAITLACYAVARRRSEERGVYAGVLVVWALLALVVSITLPAASYLFAWPVMFAAIASLTPAASRWRLGLGWLAAALTILIVISFAYGVAGVMLGVYGDGASVLGILVSLIALLVAPQIRHVFGESSDFGAAWTAVAAVVMAVLGLFTVRQSQDHPIPTALVYAENADSTGAWLGTFAEYSDAWTRSAIEPTTQVPGWTSRLRGARSEFHGRAVERAQLPGPDAKLVRDTLINGARRVVLRVMAPSGTTGLVIRASGAKVSTASIDGRIVDTTRYRRTAKDWVTEYWAVPDSGAVVALSIPAGAPIDVELVSRRPGLPSLPSLAIPRRPDYVTPSLTGDATYVYRHLRF
jgi:Predicted aminopeptidases